MIRPPSEPSAAGAGQSIATRRSLLERLKNWHDQTSWRDFFGTYWRLIYNVARKAGLTEVEAQEVVQETVIAVARKIPAFKTDPNRGSFSAWLMRLTHWRIADQFRKRQGPGNANLSLTAQERSCHDTGPTDRLQRIPDPATGPLEKLWTQEWNEHVMAVALERIKSQVRPRQYQMFDLHVVQNLSVQDTARTLRVSTAAVYMAKSRISRLLKKTALALQHEGARS